MASVHLVLTVVARDQPGIVEVLSQTVSDHGGNWLGSRMARLGGEFAGIVELHAPADRDVDLRNALAALEERGLRVQVAEASGADAPAGRTRLALEVVGNDRPGIVREISQVLARRGVNVDELDTRCESAAMAGDPLFRATAQLDVPAEVTVEALGEELEKIASDLMVDLHLQAD